MQRTSLWFASLLALSPTAFIAPSAWAQDDIEEGEPQASDPGAAETEDASASASADTGRRAEAFPIRRGVFARGDFGVLTTIGGEDFRRANSTVTSNSLSSVQPLFGVTVGYDVVSQTKFNLSVGGRFAAAFNSGAAQIPAGANDAQTFPSDFGIYQAGLALDATFMTSPRFGILAHVDGGVSFVGPDPNLPATPIQPGTTEGGVTLDDEGFVEGAGGFTVGGIFSAGGGVEYYTRLPGVSIGLTANFYGILAGDSFIPGIGVYVPLKYTF